MKADLYTKVVLTVIAMALVVIALQNTNIIPQAYANPAYPTIGNTMDVRVVEWKAYNKVDVNVKDWSTTNEVDINIDEVGGHYVNNGALQVKLQN